MKKYTLFLSAAIVAVFVMLQSCSKAADGTVGPKGDTGSTGPAGPAGLAGANGAPGAAGQNGNANVTQITFLATFVPDATGRLFTFPAAITSTILSTSAVHVYVQASNFPGVWYPIPGFISGNLDNFRTYIDAANRQVAVIRQSGTTVTSITSTRVVIIPANNITFGRKANIDYADYNAVKAAYNLPD